MFLLLPVIRIHQRNMENRAGPIISTEPYIINSFMSFQFLKAG
jgi:hypothetical protein